MSEKNINILIGGAAGQGLVTIGELLSKCLIRNGYEILVTQSYQSRIRGGHNSFVIRVSSEKITSSQEQIDILVALNAETIEKHKEDLAKDALIIVNEKDKKEIEAAKLLEVPYKELAKSTHINIVAFGILCELLGLDLESAEKTITDRFGKKKPESIKENKNVLEKAYQWASDKFFSKKLVNPEKRDEEALMIKGNQAIALGAIASGIKFFAYYPMTPSTSVGLTLIKHAKDAQIMIEQAEDEISAINMAIGASFAGAPSMVATSGGGFALMCEGISLAGITETPVVVVVAQRPGPATGLPTRTEQGDLEFVLHAGHGEFPRAIFTPGTIDECFNLTGKAFHLAEKYQSPIFILTDQFLADSYRRVKPFDEKSITEVRVGADSSEISGEYKRYRITDTGISPRLLPGQSEHLIVVDSDEHTEDGHLTEDLSVRIKMNDKRLKKFNGITEERVKPELTGSIDSDCLFIAWGSTKGAALEAINKLKDNVQASLLHFPQVWPLIASDFLEILNRSKRVISVENNALAQFARLVRRESGFNIKEKILRYDGLPITANYILENLNNTKG